MDTREAVARLLAEWACMEYAWEDYLPRAAKLCAIFAEERAALMAAMRDATGMDDEEIDNAGLAHLIEELARARDEQAARADGEREQVRQWVSRAEAAEAREAKLVEALREAREALRIYGHAIRCKYGKPGESAALPLGACTCGYFRHLIDIDAALATVKEGK